MDQRRLEVDIYQITDDAMLKQNRNDGLGWEWGWADWQREWMNATPHRYAYRCLPLTIVNQTGWWIRNPVGFSATWRGENGPGSIDFRFDSTDEVWPRWINSQFGEGIITWNTPFLFRTRPEGSRLLICGPANYFKANAHPLTALIESDWISMSFTMNWKIMVPGQPVRFDAGEPLFQAIPLVSNVCADLEEASVSYQKLSDHPELNRAYEEWNQGRRRFHEQKIAGEVRPTDWQKDYFQGRDATGRPAASLHMQKIKPPTVRYPTVGSRHSNHRPGQDTDLATADSADSRAISSLSQENHGSRSANGTTNGETTMERVTIRTSAPPASENNEASNGRNPHTSALPGGVYRVAATHDETRGAIPDQAAHIVHGRVNDEWRRWIAENLLIGQSAESVLEAMTASGFAADESAREIEAAVQSPYFRGSELLRNRLKKRDWLLAVYRKNNRLHPRSAEVERRHRLSRQEFLTEYYSTNRPVIITGMMDDWPAMGKWSLDYFARNFGDREVEVQMGRTAGANYETEREKYISRIGFGEFVEKVRTAGETNDFYLTANNNSSNRQALAELWDDVRRFPNISRPTGPAVFSGWARPARSRRSTTI